MPTKEKTIEGRKPMAIAFLLMVGALLFVMNMLAFRGGNDTSIRGESIRGSQFSVYEGRVYVLVSGSGYFVLPDADAASFEALGEGRQSHPLGKDRNAVYCGNVVIPDLDPAKLVYANRGYVSDGTHSWFCSTSRKNPYEPIWRYVLASRDDRNPGKLKAHYNALVAMPDADGRMLRAFHGDYAVDDEHVFFEGRLLSGSDARSAEVMRSANGRDDYRYLKDTNQVYYDGEPVVGADPAAFEIFRPENTQWQDEYGYNGKDGRYYAHQHAFPDTADGHDATGLRLLLADRNYANHEWFFNRTGIFYWDYRRNELRSACRIPFAAGQVSTLAPGVFSDGRDLFVTEAHDVWGEKKSPGLISRNTRMRRLRGIDVASLHNVESLRNVHGSEVGWLWQAGDRWFFQPSVGQFHHWDAALYLLDDVAAFRRRVQARNTTTLEDEALRNSRVSADIVCDSESRYRERPKWLPAFLLGWVLLTGVVAIWVSRNKLASVSMKPGAHREPVIRR